MFGFEFTVCAAGKYWQLQCCAKHNPGRFKERAVSMP